jgi:hypothetical protein
MPKSSDSPARTNGRHSNKIRPLLWSAGIIATGLIFFFSTGRAIQAPAVLLSTPPTAPIQIAAFVPDAILADLKIGAFARFYPRKGGPAFGSFKVVAIDSALTQDLEHQQLASAYGGPLATTWGAGGEILLADKMHRIILERIGPIADEVRKSQTIAGNVLIERISSDKAIAQATASSYAMKQER